MFVCSFVSLFPFLSLSRSFFSSCTTDYITGISNSSTLTKHKATQPPLPTQHHNGADGQTITKTERSKNTATLHSTVSPSGPEQERQYFDFLFTEGPGGEAGERPNLRRLFIKITYKKDEERPTDRPTERTTERTNERTKEEEEEKHRAFTLTLKLPDLLASTRY